MLLSNDNRISNIYINIMYTIYIQYPAMILKTFADSEVK